MSELQSLPWVDIVGYGGGAFTLWAMYAKTIIPLRIGIVCGNVGLLLFGALAASWPTMVLHAVLLPVNAFRLYQMIRLVREMRQTADEGGTLEPLLQVMERKDVPAETLLFRKDDPSDQMIVIGTGAVMLEEIDIEIGPGDVLGEIGAFTPDNKRTCTARCKTDCTLYTLSNEALLQLYYQNPKFGLALVRIIVQRLVTNWQQADARVKAMIS